MPPLEKPDLNKPMFDVFPKAREYIMLDRCPCCKKVINTGMILLKDCTREDLSSLFRDALSKKEYSISGLCQDCQDKVFEAEVPQWHSTT